MGGLSIEREACPVGFGGRKHALGQVR